MTNEPTIEWGVLDMNGHISDVNVTEKVARAWEDRHFLDRVDLTDDDERRAFACDALSVLADPDVLAGIAGVLRQSFADSTCGGHLDLAGDVADWMPEATAVVEWLRGRAC